MRRAKRPLARSKGQIDARTKVNAPMTSTGCRSRERSSNSIQVSNSSVLRCTKRGGSVENTRTGYVLNASLHHGEPAVLRKSLEFNWSINQFRLARGLDLGLIDRDLLGAGLGSQDVYTARLSLLKAWSRQHGRAWLEYGRFRSSDDLSTLRQRRRETLFCRTFAVSERESTVTSCPASQSARTQ